MILVVTGSFTPRSSPTRTREPAEPTCGTALLQQQPRAIAAPAGASYGVCHGRSSSKYLFEEVFVFPASKAASLDLQEPTMTCAADRGHERHEHAHAHGHARGVGRCSCCSMCTRGGARRELALLVQLSLYLSLCCVCVGTYLSPSIKFGKLCCCNPAAFLKLRRILLMASWRVCLPSYDDVALLRQALA